MTRPSIFEIYGLNGAETKLAIDLAQTSAMSLEVAVQAVARTATEARLSAEMRAMSGPFGAIGWRRTRWYLAGAIFVAAVIIGVIAPDWTVQYLGPFVGGVYGALVNEDRHYRRGRR